MISWLYKLPTKVAVKYFPQKSDKELSRLGCFNNRMHCVDADPSVPQKNTCTI